jgi:galactokinase
VDIRQHVMDLFKQRFGGEAEVMARAPGRVNLLGEHVDYNDGIVLPTGIDRATWVAFRRSGMTATTILAADLNEETTFTPESVMEKKTNGGMDLADWACYPAGVMWSLNRKTLDTPAMEAVFASDVPRGAGLSSSASVELAFAAAWQHLADWRLPPMELALLCQQAERKYVGVNCGIMDQFASACSVKDHVLDLDCRSLQWKTLDLPAGVAIVIADTTIRRSLTGSAYNERRASCEEAVRILQGTLPGIKSLRDIRLDEFNQNASRLPPVVEKRARHVVEEIARTEKAVQLLQAQDIHGFGRLMNECHTSLRDLYEVSCPELDIMVEIAQSLPGCFGARLTGAGFGGCTVNIISQDDVDDFVSELGRKYEAKTSLHSLIYVCNAVDGASTQTL